MNKDKRWIVTFHVCTVASDPYEAAKKARDRVAKYATPYIECLGEALPEDYEDDEAEQ